MRVLVTAASKHGGTAEIAVSIAESVEEGGHATVVARPEEIVSLEGYGAVVLGSAVYGGHWLEEARAFVKKHRVALASVPVWLFSSGPIGEPPKPETEAVDVTTIQSLTHAREHRLFPGRLIRHELGFAERAIVTSLGTPDGDFRPWDDIDTYGRDVALALDAQVIAEAAPEPVGQSVG